MSYVGLIFALLAMVFFGFAIYYFAFVQIIDRGGSPAESRLKNKDCEFLAFYDAHDLWHFFSGAGIFMSFMGLLTMDDDILNVPRDQIDIF